MFNNSPTHKHAVEKYLYIRRVNDTNTRQYTSNPAHNNTKAAYIIIVPTTMIT